MKSPFLDVVVESIDADGYGVGNVDARTVHVKGACPSGTTPVLRRVRIVKRRRGHWYGVADPAVDGAAPCPAHPICGGCSVQHLDATRQLAHKQAHVLGLLAGHGIEPAHVCAPVSGPQFHYRRRARLGVRHLEASDDTLVGFRESFGSRVARADNCLVLAEPLYRAFPAIKAAVATLDARHRIPQIELSAGDRGGAMVLRHLVPLSARDLAALHSLATSTGLEVLLQGSGQDSVTSLSGGQAARLDYRLDTFGVLLAFDPMDFVQINAEVNRALVAAAVAWLKPSPGDRIVDLFCGIGNFTLPIARSGASVDGIEAAAGVVARARENASRNGLDGRVSFGVADLYGVLGDAVRAAVAGADGALVDPPRSGIGPLVNVLARSRVGRLAYVSCHPVSFAADVAALVGAGFRLDRLAVFDMFPHTTHVETLALLERR